MVSKTVKSEVFEINTSLLNKAQKTIYNKVSNKYRFWETYDFLKFIYKNEVDFSDIFMRVHISELPDSDAGVVPDTFAMRFSRV